MYMRFFLLQHNRMPLECPPPFSAIFCGRRRTSPRLPTSVTWGFPLTRLSPRLCAAERLWNWAASLHLQILQGPNGLRRRSWAFLYACHEILGQIANASSHVALRVCRISFPTHLHNLCWFFSPSLLQPHTIYVSLNSKLSNLRLYLWL